MAISTIRRLSSNPGLIETQADENRKKQKARALELERQQRERRETIKNIRRLGKDITRIFTLFFPSETPTGFNNTQAIKTFIKNLANPLAFTKGNNYQDAFAMILTANEILGKAPDLNQLCKNILNLFIYDQHVCCLSFRGKGGTGPSSFKTFLGLLLGVDFSLEPTETDADRKSLIYSKLVSLSRNTAIEMGLRGTLQGIYEDKFFEDCHPKITLARRFSMSIAVNPGDLTTKLLSPGMQ